MTKGEIRKARRDGADARLRKPRGRWASVVQVECLSERAVDWALENLALDGWQWLGESFGVEARYVEEVVARMAEGGLAVCVEG
jgi:hypothetical protein